MWLRAMLRFAKGEDDGSKLSASSIFIQRQLRCKVECSMSASDNQRGALVVLKDRSSLSRKMRQGLFDGKDVWP